MRGVRESAETNNVMVAIKVIAILIFVFGAAKAVNTENWRPFMPNGFPGVLTGAAIVFFTYIGFDSVSTAAEECKNPQRDLPIGIIATLIICTVLYCSVAIVLTGIQNYKTLNNAAPVVNALKALGYENIRRWVGVGAIIGHGVFPAGFPVRTGAHLVCDVARSSAAGVLLQECTRNTARRTSAPGWQDSRWAYRPASGTSIPSRTWPTSARLFAFILVSLGVIVLRRKQPDRRRGFRVPWVPFLPIVSMVCCLVLMMSLPLATWIRFFVWLAIGLVIYFMFSKKHSQLADNPE